MKRSPISPTYDFFTRVICMTGLTLTQIVQRKRYPIGTSGQPIKFDEERVIFAAPLSKGQIERIKRRTYNLCQDLYMVESCLPDHGIDGYAWIIINECIATLTKEGGE